MNYALRGIHAEELSFSINHVNLKDAKVKFNPKYTCEIKNLKDNNKIWTATIGMSWETSEEEVTPFNISVKMLGAFEAEGIETEEDKQLLAVSMMEVVFPYLRTAVTNVTASANVMPPVVLPVIPASVLFSQSIQEKAGELKN